MKVIIIITLLVLSSCSSKVMINGVQVKTKNKIPQREIPVLIGSFIIGYTITPMLIKK